MAVVSAHGMATPFDPDGEPYAVFGNRVPALRGFRLTYPGGEDHQIVLMGVLPGGASRISEAGYRPTFPMVGSTCICKMPILRKMSLATTSPIRS